jgi:predicted AAA+ superfamily ATPase
MYKPIAIDRERLTLMGVPFPDLETLENAASGIGSNMFEGYEPTPNGIPLGAEINPRKQKMLILDTGILQRIQKLPPADLLLENELSLVNRGGIAELHVGLELLKATSCYEQAALYYWQREERGSQAEVDYVVAAGRRIIPIEVKSGSRGKMQSLAVFLQEKRCAFGVRTSLENYGEYGEVRVVPLYGVGVSSITQK